MEDMPPPRPHGQQTCPECGKPCKNPYLLKKHIEAKHQPGSPDLLCPLCGKLFDNKHRRAGHIGKCTETPAVVPLAQPSEAAAGERHRSRSRSSSQDDQVAEVQKPTAKTPAVLVPLAQPSEVAAGERHRLRSQDDQVAEVQKPTAPRHQCDRCEKSFILPSRLAKHAADAHGDR